MEKSMILTDRSLFKANKTKKDKREWKKKTEKKKERIV